MQSQIDFDFDAKTHTSHALYDPLMKLNNLLINGNYDVIIDKLNPKTTQIQIHNIENDTQTQLQLKNRTSETFTGSSFRHPCYTKKPTFVKIPLVDHSHNVEVSLGYLELNTDILTDESYIKTKSEYGDICLHAMKNEGKIDVQMKNCAPNTTTITISTISKNEFKEVS